MSSNYEDRYEQAKGMAKAIQDAERQSQVANAMNRLVVRKVRLTPALDAFIDGLQGELRTGGGATLDELSELALAVREDMKNL